MFGPCSHAVITLTDALVLPQPMRRRAGAGNSHDHDPRTIKLFPSGRCGSGNTPTSYRAKKISRRRGLAVHRHPPGPRYQVARAAHGMRGQRKQSGRVFLVERGEYDDGLDHSGSLLNFNFRREAAVLRRSIRNLNCTAAWGIRSFVRRSTTAKSMI